MRHTRIYTLKLWIIGLANLLAISCRSDVTLPLQQSYQPAGTGNSDMYMYSKDGGYYGNEYYNPAPAAEALVQEPTPRAEPYYASYSSDGLPFGYKSIAKPYLTTNVCNPNEKYNINIAVYIQNDLVREIALSMVMPLNAEMDVAMTEALENEKIAQYLKYLEDLTNDYTLPIYGIQFNLLFRRDVNNKNYTSMAISCESDNISAHAAQLFFERLRLDATSSDGKVDQIGQSLFIFGCLGKSRNLAALEPYVVQEPNSCDTFAALVYHDLLTTLLLARNTIIYMTGGFVAMPEYTSHPQQCFYKYPDVVSPYLDPLTEMNVPEEILVSRLSGKYISLPELFKNSFSEKDNIPETGESRLVYSLDYIRSSIMRYGGYTPSNTTRTALCGRANRCLLKSSANAFGERKLNFL